MHLDGDHSYQGIRSDFRIFFPRLAAGGILTVHDIRTKNAGGLSYGVQQFWQEIKAAKRYNCMELPGTYGLGLIQA
jgi:hypothetical protein